MGEIVYQRSRLSGARAALRVFLPVTFLAKPVWWLRPCTTEPLLSLKPLRYLWERVYLVQAHSVCTLTMAPNTILCMGFLEFTGLAFADVE